MPNLLHAPQDAWPCTAPLNPPRTDRRLPPNREVSYHRLMFRRIARQHRGTPNVDGTIHEDVVNPDTMGAGEHGMAKAPPSLAERVAQRSPMVAQDWAFRREIEVPRHNERTGPTPLTYPVGRGLRRAKIAKSLELPQIACFNPQAGAVPLAVERR